MLEVITHPNGTTQKRPRLENMYVTTCKVCKHAVIRTVHEYTWFRSPQLVGIVHMECVDKLCIHGQRLAHCSLSARGVA